MKRIEFGELRINESSKRYIQDCLDTNWVSMGPKTKLLEEKFAELMGTKYAVATSSGTSSIAAMTLALPEICKRRVIRGKSKVICPALAFIANSTGIVSGGLIPKWVDIRPSDLNIDETLVEEAIDDDVVAIYAVGTMGKPANMPELKRIADKYDLLLFEDACENYGSSINDQPSHSYAIAGCSSFFQAHLVQAGEGSCIYTDDENLRDLLVSIRSHGRHPNSAYFDHVRFGSNFKTTDLCASLALGAIEEFHQNIIERKKIWSELVDYCQRFTNNAWFSHETGSRIAMPHGFSITTMPPYRQNGLPFSDGLQIKDLQNLMDEFNIHWKRNFGFCGDHPSLKDFNQYNTGDYEWAKWCGNNGIHIGTHRYMSDDDVERIKECLRRFFE